MMSALEFWLAKTIVEALVSIAVIVLLIVLAIWATPEDPRL